MTRETLEALTKVICNDNAELFQQFGAFFEHRIDFSAVLKAVEGSFVMVEWTIGPTTISVRVKK